MALNLGTLMVQLKATTADFNRKMTAAKASVQNLSAGLSQVSMATGAASAALTGLGIYALRTSAKFEASMTRVKAISQANTQQFKALTDEAKRLGATTEWSAKQVADGMQFMAMAGFKTNQIIGAMPQVLQLATAGQMDLARSADIITNIMTGMRVPIEDLGRANDTLVATFTNSNVALDQLGEAFKYVGSVAKVAGLSFEEISASIGLLGNAGLQGSMAGTTLRGAIAKIVNPSDEAKEAIERLGLSMVNSSGEVLPMVDLLKQLEKAGLKTADYMTIFGLRAGPGMAALVGQGSEALEKLMKTIEDAGGVAEKIQKEQLQTLEGRILILKSAFEGLMISIGDVINPLAKDLVNALIKVLEWFNGLSDNTKKYIVIIGAVTAGVLALTASFTGMLAVLPFIMQGFMAFKAVIPVLGAVLVPLMKIGFILGGIMALIGSVSNLFKSFGVDGGKILSDLGGDLLKWIIRPFKQFGSMISGVLTSLVAGIAQLSGQGAEKAKMTAEAFKETLSDLVNPTQIIKDVSGAAKDGFKVVGGTLISTFDKAFNDIENLASSSGGVIADNLIDEDAIAANIDASLDNVFGEDLELPGLEQAVDEAVTKGLENANYSATVNTATGGTGVYDTTGGTTGGTTAAANEELTSARSSLTENVKEINRMFGEFGNSLNTIIDGFQGGGLAGGFTAIGVELFKRTESFKKIVDMLNKFMTIAAKILEPIAKTLNKLLIPVLKITLTIMQVLQPVIEFFAIVIESMASVMNVVAKIITGIIKGIAAVWNGIISAIAWVFDMLSHIPIIGGLFGAIAGQINRLKISTGGLDSSFQQLEGSTNSLSSSMDAAAGNMTMRSLAAQEALNDMRDELLKTFGDNQGGKDFVETILTSIDPGAEGDQAFAEWLQEGLTSSERAYLAQKLESDIAKAGLTDKLEGKGAGFEEWAATGMFGEDVKQGAGDKYGIDFTDINEIIAALAGQRSGYAQEAARVFMSLYGGDLGDKIAAALGFDASDAELKQLLGSEFLSGKLDEFQALFSDATEEAATSLEDFSETVEDVNESISNVPEGFKMFTARFSAIDAEDSALNATGNVIDQVNIIGVEDPETVANMVTEQQELNDLASSGSSTPESKGSAVAKRYRRVSP